MRIQLEILISPRFIQKVAYYKNYSSFFYLTLQYIMKILLYSIVLI